MSDEKIHQPTILVGVTGCIAAYKSCELVRALQNAGARVKVVMTEHGAEFVTPVTFKALTREPVALELFDDPNAPIHHISLAREADVFVIAPATANVINKLAAGVADDLLTTTALATAAPLLVAPAMNNHMWRDQTVQESLKTLRQRGVMVIEPESGYLACGDVGEGRLAAIEQIAQAALAELKRARDLAGQRILITAGPTREPLDPVRFISSPSSGLTGYAIAEEAARRGAEVTLVSGPVSLPDPFDVAVVRVQTAQEMFEAAKDYFSQSTAAIFTAAVADFRPQATADQKLKKGIDTSADGSLAITMVPNIDILATLAAQKGSRFVVGFAAETQDVVAAGQGKLVTKNADLIIANDVSDPTRGFGSKHNQVWFISADAVEQTKIITKKELARLLLDKVVARFC
ncbi:MAG: bifunctional phosphopantothenoylcysteine decarboxylase/phosphopantothenate--cysteine ligase CoaBC [Coriobacteriaceae bacterium]|nr:bifunctional phosphopantothenoylcysteine decarboxylase/phosphopantothenate--cysteine ligase CoaBC [Coriobacteriaceae bacterium]